MGPFVRIELVKKAATTFGAHILQNDALTLRKSAVVFFNGSKQKNFRNADGSGCARVVFSSAITTSSFDPLEISPNQICPFSTFERV
jgi:hypothetical protein